MLEGHAFVGNVQPFFISYKFLLQGNLGNAIDIGEALNGEAQTDQHAELIVLLLKFGIGFLQTLREAIACDIKEGRYLLPVFLGKGDVLAAPVSFLNSFVKVVLFHDHLPHHGKLVVFVCQLPVVLLARELLLKPMSFPLDLQLALGLIPYINIYKDTSHDCAGE